MLDDTLVVWTTEFGRSPHEDGPNGRNHQNAVYSSWMAGGGVKGGIAWGQSDDFGAKVADERSTRSRFSRDHSSLLGFDHTKLTFRYAGRDFRLTDVAGNVVEGLLV